MGKCVGGVGVINLRVYEESADFDNLFLFRKLACYSEKGVEVVK